MNTIHLSSINEAQLLPLLNKMQILLTSFEETLEVEKQAIRHSKFDALQQNTATKAKLADQLDQLASQIETEIQIPFSELLDAIDLFPESQMDVKDRLTKINQLTNQCHDLNLANGISINILNNMNNFTLNLLSGRDPNSKTYSAKGQKQEPATTGRALGKA